MNDLPIAERTGTCPTCGHRAGKPVKMTFLDRLLGNDKHPAQCRGQGEQWSGWGGEICGCSDPFHGS